MTSVQRHVYGDPKPEVLPVALATAIEIGDMCWFDATNNVVEPAVTYIGATDLATTQGTFKDVFCGVARSAHKANDANVTTVVVDTAGTFRMPTASAAFDAGVFVGPAATAVVNYALAGTLSSQKLVAVANATLGIGKVARQYTSAVTEIYARLTSTVHDPAGGAQTIT